MRNKEATGLGLGFHVALSPGAGDRGSLQAGGVGMLFATIESGLSLPCVGNRAFKS